MEQATSIDGTRIAFARRGTGDPVLLVHGTTGSAASWAMVAPHLESQFTVVTMDRRGRGESGDGAEYSLDLEAADVGAVVDAIGEGVHVVGHSYGARVALLAAMRSSGVQSLTLYEPPLSVLPSDVDIAHRAGEFARTGDPDAGAVLMLSELGIATPEELSFLQSFEPAWEGICAGMLTAPREIEAELATVDLDAVGAIQVPVLILVGEDTTLPAILDGLDAFERAFPDVRRAIIPGQRHLAVGFAGEVFAGLLESFLLNISRSQDSVPDTG